MAQKVNIKNQISERERERERDTTRNEQELAQEALIHFDMVKTDYPFVLQGYCFPAKLTYGIFEKVCIEVKKINNFSLKMSYDRSFCTNQSGKQTK